MELAAIIGSYLDLISVLASRYHLDTPGVEASTPMLRGVWGAALREVGPEAYSQVFEGGFEGTPAYIFRPAPADPRCWPAVDFMLLGPAVQHAAAASAAWQCLCERGLGPERHNVTIQNTFILGPAARNDPRVAPVWVLSKADTPPADQPCRLTFSAPLRLLRNGHLIEQPSLADIVIAGARRIGLFLPVPAQKHWNALGRQLLELAKDTPAGIFEGDRRDFYRYSGRQKRELGMRGVSGALLLPNGPGELAGLLGALEWLHIGKGAVFGLGQPTLESFPAPPPKTAEPI